jgi:hypothetical protein
LTRDSEDPVTTPAQPPSSNDRPAPRLLGGHWRTLLGAAAGAIGGAAYAHFIGCRTGTCAITSSPFVSALFFGFTGAVIAAPGPRKGAEAVGDAPRSPAAR